jgi:hypothetical protein
MQEETSMLASPGRYFVLLLLCATVALPLRSEETPPAKQSASKKTSGSEKKLVPGVEGKKTVELKKMDLASLPADAVIVICEHANEALDLVPQAVILRPDKYQAMRDEIERLKKQLQTEKPAAPTRCLLRGKVESGAVRLEAEFAGTAEHANAVVTLACPQAGAAAAETDGRMALIRRSESGDFLVRIEKPGEYHVKLDLILPLASREGNGRGFELTLPRAVITQLELDLPANIKDVRVGGRTLDEPQLRGLKLNNNRHLSGNPGLEPVEKLNLSWKEVRNATGDPVRMAEGRIQVRVDAVGQTTEAELVLKVEGAPTDVWRLLVPLKAEIRVLPPDDARVKTPIETADQKFASLRTLHLREPSADPLHLQIKVPLAPRNGLVMPIGPFFVLDAARQTGTVEVRNPVRNLHLDYRGHGDMQLRRQQAEEEGNGETPATVATFEYSNIPMLEKPKETSGPNSLSWLDVEARTVHPQVRTRVSHTLTLRHSPLSLSGSPAEKGANDRRDAGPAEWHWEIVTTIAPVANKWTDIDQLKVFVPPEWNSSDENVSITPHPNPSPQRGEGQGMRGYVTIPSSQLREAPAGSLRLEGRFEANYKADGRTILKLPRPQGITDSCEVKIEAPAEAEVVLNNAEQANLELSKQPRPNEQTWRCRGPLADGLGIDVSWRPYRPELRVMAVVDLTLTGNRGDVRHEIWLQLPPSPPPFLDLRVPPAVRDSLQVQGENPQELREVAVGPDGKVRLPIPAKAGGTEWRRVLHYKTPLAENNHILRAGEPFTVPLVVPKQATAGDIRVRVWSEPGFLPRPAADPRWEEQGIEEVKDRALPVLVLHATKLDAPLRLILGEQAAGFSALIERALVRVQLLEGGAQNWRASFQFRCLADRNLDILLPGPAATLNAQFFFNRHKVTPDIVNDQGERTDGGTIARLRLSPDLIRQTALLEVWFQSPPGRTGRSPLHTTLQPPQIRGAPAVPIRWQVSVPANRVLLAPESASGVERVWTRRGWLLAAHLQRTSIDAELERAFENALPDKPPQSSDPAAFAAASETTPALVCWQDHAAPIVLTHAPQQAWLLVCSLGVLIVGLGLYWSARPRAGDGRLAAWFWPLLALLTLALALGALFWPTTLSAAVYGCEPGLLVLLAVIGLQWLMHQRYRRQIVFLPSFSRGRAGSSLIRKNSSNRPPSGEPSTVDAPPPSVG